MTAADLDELLYDFIANGVVVTASGDIEIAGGLGAKLLADLRGAGFAAVPVSAAEGGE